MTSSLSTDSRARTEAALPRRVVVLGASNLTKGIGTVVAAAHGTWGRPLEMFAALGHGRSYGRASSVLGRQLPAILDCGMWRDLAALPTASTAALVTDIGNDLLYEEPVARIATWVEECLDRLAALQARTVVTALPLDNLQTLSAARFYLLRSIFFPHSRLRLAQVATRAEALDFQVRRLAGERGFDVVGLRPQWYGFDPIHIRFWKRSMAWREILAGWSASPGAALPARSSLTRTLYLRSRTPRQRRVLGFVQRGRQPAARLSDGTTVAIY